MGKCPLFQGVEGQNAAKLRLFGQLSVVGRPMPIQSVRKWAILRPFLEGILLNFGKIGGIELSKIVITHQLLPERHAMIVRQHA